MYKESWQIIARLGDLAFTEFFGEENTTNISNRECAISIRNNYTSLIEIISKSIKILLLLNIC